MKEMIATRAILINSVGKVLLGKRARGIGEGKYALVGGKPDNNEVPIETIIREVKEEIGVDFDPNYWLASRAIEPSTNDNWQVYFYLGIVDPESVKFNKDEITEIIYVGQQDLDKIDIAFNHKEILQKYFKESLSR